MRLLAVKTEHEAGVKHGARSLVTTCRSVVVHAICSEASICLVELLTNLLEVLFSTASKMDQVLSLCDVHVLD